MARTERIELRLEPDEMERWQRFAKDRAAIRGTKPNLSEEIRQAMGWMIASMYEEER